MITTERISGRVPRALVDEARDRWPTASELPTVRLMRFALALAAGHSETDALALTRDARIIDRPPTP